VRLHSLLAVAICGGDCIPQARAFGVFPSRARTFPNRYHANTTGPEIVKDFAGQKLDYWVTGYGTGGTLAGAGKIIKAARPDTKVCVCVCVWCVCVCVCVCVWCGAWRRPNLSPHSGHTTPYPRLRLAPDPLRWRWGYLRRRGLRRLSCRNPRSRGCSRAVSLRSARATTRRRSHTQHSRPTRFKAGHPTSFPRCAVGCGVGA
jgi:hypothetical protein